MSENSGSGSIGRFGRDLFRPDAAELAELQRLVAAYPAEAQELLDELRND